MKHEQQSTVCTKLDAEKLYCKTLPRAAQKNTFYAFTKYYVIDRKQNKMAEGDRKIYSIPVDY